MDDLKKAFIITGSRGVHLTFPNGYHISIQWGVANYCDHHHDRPFTIGQEKQSEFWESNTAEIGIFDNNNDWDTRRAHMDVAGEELGDDVIGYVEITEVLKYINWVSIQAPKKKTKKENK